MVPSVALFGVNWRSLCLEGLGWAGERGVIGHTRINNEFKNISAGM